MTITAGRGTTLLYRPTQSPYEEGVPARVMEGARCQNVKTNQISMRQEMVVIGNAWYFDCCAEHREFSIVRIFDEDKVVGMDTAGKLSLRPKEISELIPAEERNSAQNKLGLGAGTGDWIIYVTHEARNYYLCIAKHGEDDFIFNQ